MTAPESTVLVPTARRPTRALRRGAAAFRVLLALLCCASLASALRLAHLRGVEERTLEDLHRAGAERLDRYRRLGRLALEIVSPAHEVFDSGELEAEMARSDLARRALAAELERARADAERLASPARARLLAGLEGVRTTTDEMMADVDRTFASFGVAAPPEVAVLNAHLERIDDRLALLARQAREAEAEAARAHRSAASGWTAPAAFLAALAAALAAAPAGVRLARVMRLRVRRAREGGVWGAGREPPPMAGEEPATDLPPAPRLALVEGAAPSDRTAPGPGEHAADDPPAPRLALVEGAAPSDRTAPGPGEHAADDPPVPRLALVESASAGDRTAPESAAGSSSGRVAWPPLALVGGDGPPANGATGSARGAGREPAARLAERLRRIEERLPGTVGMILLRAGGRLRVAAAPSLSDELCGAIDEAAADPPAHSWIEAAARSRVIAGDTSTHAAWSRFRRLARQHGLRSSCAEPMVSEAGEAVGVLVTFRRRVHVPGRDEIELVARAARDAAQAVA